MMTTRETILLRTLLTAGVLMAGFMQAATVTATAEASLVADNPRITIEPGFFTESWQSGSTSVNYNDLSDSYPIRFNMGTYGNNEVKGAATFTQEGNSINASYNFTADKEITLNALYIGVTFPVDELAGGSWACNDRSGTFPEEYKEMSLMGNRTRCITLTTANGQKIRFDFPDESSVFIQDNRRWSQNFTLRIGHINKFTFRKGENRSVNFKATLPSPVNFKRQTPVTLTAGDEWTPLNVDLEIEEGSALDFSKLGFVDAPAGKYGRIICKGPHFVFEKKEEIPQRFYGVNFCFTANYLEKETAEKIAGRLARIGYNTIRIHHHDTLMTAGSADGAELNEENMRRFDDFTAAMINEGIYLSTDLFVSRKVPWKAIGIDKPGDIPMDTFKKLVPVHEGAYNNLKKYVTNWLSHVNPNTGRSYAHEPALAWINLLNEANFGNHYNEIKEIPEWGQAWREWLAEKKRLEPDKYKTIPDTVPENGDLGRADPHSAAFLLFFRDKEIEMVKRFRKLLQEELDCKALITNANGWSHYLPDHFVRSGTYDYVDEHFYVDHPHFIQRPWNLPSRCPNTNPVKNRNYGCRPEIYMRHYDKPFTITEYNYSGPGRFRGVGGILCGTLAALQDWSGLWRFAYSHSGNSLSSLKPQNLGYFDMLNDPLSLAAERASICLFLRQDIAPLKKTAVIYLPEDRFNSPANTYYASKNLWPALGWSYRTGVQAGGPEPEKFDHTGIYPEVFEQYKADKDVIPFIGKEVADVVKENKALAIDNESGTFIINTEKTCGGFTENGRLDAGALSVDITESAATVWVSSIDNKPVSDSSRIILTHLTDIQNTGIKYAEESRQTLLKWGGLPHLVRKGRAAVDIKLNDAGNYKVYALATSGKRMAEIPAEIKDGRLCFTVKTDVVEGNATIVYEIVNE